MFFLFFFPDLAGATGSSACPFPNWLGATDMAHRKSPDHLLALECSLEFGLRLRVEGKTSESSYIQAWIDCMIWNQHISYGTCSSFCVFSSMPPQLVGSCQIPEPKHAAATSSNRSNSIALIGAVEAACQHHRSQILQKNR